MTYGLSEGRTVSFDLGAYSAGRPDVGQYYQSLGQSGAELDASIASHYIMYGRFEALGYAPPSLWTDSQAMEYLLLNPDLIQYFNSNPAGFLAQGQNMRDVARQHFTNFGWQEGRATTGVTSAQIANYVENNTVSPATLAGVISRAESLYGQGSAEAINTLVAHFAERETHRNQFFDTAVRLADIRLEASLAGEQNANIRNDLLLTSTLLPPRI